MANLNGVFRVSDHLKTTPDLHESFRLAMVENDLHPEEIFETDTFQRFSTVEKPNRKDGYYALTMFDGYAWGCFGDWSRAIHEKWSSHDNSTLSVQERSDVREKQKELSRQIEEKKKQKHLESRVKAKLDLEHAEVAREHKYLTQKGVNCQPDFKINPLDILLIPVKNIDNETISYQRIMPDGSKRFMAGGQTSGGFYPISGHEGIICICEGVATGLTINQATGYTVVCAFSAGNLRPVAEQIRERYSHKIIICADNDSKTQGNPGVKYGKEAAALVEGFIAFPFFGHESGTDFNDLADKRGLAEVKKQIDAAISDAPTPLDYSNLLLLDECFSEEPPKRQYLIEGLIPFGKVGAIVGAGGTGKSNFLALVARVMASGLKISDIKAQDNRKVLIINVEDDEDDIKRRLYAQAQIYPLKQGELYHLKQNLMIYAGVGIVKPFMKLDGSNPSPTVWATWLDQTIGLLKPDCVFLDTRSRLYGLDENNNDHGTQWVGMLEAIVKKYGCSFIVVHHTSKHLAGKHDSGASRGASSFVDSCRFVISLAGMDEKTAKKIGISNQRWKYFSVTTTKSNYTEAFGPIWFEKRKEGVPYQVNLEAIKRGLVRDFIIEWFSNNNEQLSKRDAVSQEAGTTLRKHIKECLGIGRDELGDWIEDMLVEETLKVQSVHSNSGGKPKKVLVLNE